MPRPVLRHAQPRALTKENIHATHRLRPRQHTRSVPRPPARRTSRARLQPLCSPRPPPASAARRPEWDACLAHLRAGDRIVVVELSRLGRNTGDLGQLLDHLDEHKISLRILNLGIDTRTPAGRLFTIIGAVAAMERELLIERTQSGLA